MGMKVVCPVLVMITISMLGCASLEKSDECMSARQRFENEGLNIDQFRGDRTSDEFVRRAKGLAMFHYFPSRYGTQFEKVSDFAVFSCGPVEGARTKRRVPSTMDLLDQDRPGIRLEDSILGEFADGHRELLAAANLGFFRLSCA